jgi:hypothetical protein
MIRFSAVVAILGSAVMLLLAVLMIVTGAFGPPASDQALSPKVLTAIMIVMAAIFTALAVWGISTAIGLFRRRPWSRISILIFAGVLTLFAASGLLMMPFMQFPVDPNVGARLTSIIRLSMFGFYAALTAIGVWWLILFNLRSSRRYFGGPADARASGKPLSVSLIAWYLLIAAAMMPLVAILRLPAFIFGVVFTKGAALAIYIASLWRTSTLASPCCGYGRPPESAPSSTSDLSQSAEWFLRSASTRAK